MKLFVDTIGDIPAGKIDKKAVRTWKGLLWTIRSRPPRYRCSVDMTMREIIRANEKVQKPKITNRTVNRYLSSLGAFCDWLVRNDYLDQNPVEGQHQAVEKHKRSTRPFTIEQMNKLFASPLFTGCQNDDDWHKAGNRLIRDHRYWLPLVMLYSGARPAEIAQLAVEDVRDDKGTWIILITESDDDDKTVKTTGSMRVVPVHSELIKLGFVDYRNAAKARGEARLFPAAVRNQCGQMAADFRATSAATSRGSVSRRGADCRSTISAMALSMRWPACRIPRRAVWVPCRAYVAHNDRPIRATSPGNAAPTRRND